MRRLVVGVDGSQEAAAAALWTAREALRRGLPVHLVHAWGWHPQLPAPLDVTARSRAKRTMCGARTAVESACPQVRVTTEMIMEQADVALLAAAGSAEMLVLGSRGHTAVSGFLLGSVSHQILARAPCPVAMVRASGTAARGRPGREVVVGLQDLEHPAQPLLRFAFTAADGRGAPVRAVHAWDVPSDVRYDRQAVQLVDDDRTMAARKEKALADAIDPWKARYPHLGVVQQVVMGSPGGTLAAAASDAAVVVVGRKVHRPVLGMRIGPVAHDVLHHVTAPVVVVPHD